jgi:hypothetical protein
MLKGRLRRSVEICGGVLCPSLKAWRRRRIGRRRMYLQQVDFRMVNSSG